MIAISRIRVEAHDADMLLATSYREAQKYHIRALQCYPATCKYARWLSSNHYNEVKVVFSVRIERADVSLPPIWPHQDEMRFNGSRFPHLNASQCYTPGVRAAARREAMPRLGIA